MRGGSRLSHRSWLVCIRCRCTIVGTSATELPALQDVYRSDCRCNHGRSGTQVDCIESLTIRRRLTTSCSGRSSIKCQVTWDGAPPLNCGLMRLSQCVVAVVAAAGGVSA